MRTHIATWCFLLWFSLTASPALARDVVTVAATSDVISGYQSFLAGKSPSQVMSFNSPHATRMVVDLVLMHQALELGGMPGVEFRFLEVPNSERERVEVKSGHAVVGSQDYWESDFDDSVYMSAPVIRDGEFEKGLYTLPSNTAMLAVRDRGGLTGLTAVMIPTWKRDHAVLESLNLKGIHPVYGLETMIRFIAMTRADFTLLEFSSKPDLSISLYGVTLVPVPGIKIIIPGNRCLMVSRNNPAGEKVFEALSKGLAILEKQGTFRRAFIECGFIQERVSGWHVINR